MWWIKAKRESVISPSGKEYEYIINPTRSEYQRFFQEHGAADGSSRLTLVRGILSGELLGVPGDLYIWDPYLIIHRGFSRAVGVNKYVPVYLSENEAYVSTNQWDKKYWPISIKVVSDVIGFVKGSEMMENIYGNNFSVEFKDIY